MPAAYEATGTSPDPERGVADQDAELDVGVLARPVKLAEVTKLVGDQRSG